MASEEMEGGIQQMCNLSELIVEDATRMGLEQGLEQGRLEAIQKLIAVNCTKEFILGLGYSEKGSAFAGLFLLIIKILHINITKRKLEDKK